MKDELVALAVEVLGVDLLDFGRLDAIRRSYTCGR